jgi:hypothetical protein
MADFSPDALARALKNTQVEEEDQATQPQPATSNHKLMRALGLPVFMGGQLADYFTTLKALDNPNNYEANPIFGEHPGALKLAAMKLGPAAAMAYGLDKFGNKHPKAALALALAGGGASLGIAARNARK